MVPRLRSAVVCPGDTAACHNSGEVSLLGVDAEVFETNAILHLLEEGIDTGHGELLIAGRRVRITSQDLCIMPQCWRDMLLG